MSANRTTGEEPATGPTELPRVDVAETVGLFVLSVLAVGGALVVAADGTDLRSALLSGGIVGWFLVRLRLEFYAVRTEGGVERRRYPPDRSWWGRTADYEYDPSYDRYLAAACAVVGVGAFVAVALVDANDSALLALVVVGHLGLLCALMAYGVSKRDG